MNKEITHAAHAEIWTVDRLFCENPHIYTAKMLMTKICFLLGWCAFLTVFHINGGIS